MGALDMKATLPLLATALLLSPEGPVLAQGAGDPCYQILVDGKDHSAYQYVNKGLVTFADPVWKEDPAVRDIHLVDAISGKHERSPVIQRANYIASRAWGGVMFQHIPFGKILTLRAGTNRVSFQRRGPGKGCPNQDFRLDDRMNGYEVLQYCPSEVYMGLAPLGSHIQPAGQEVILNTVLLFTRCSGILHSAGDGHDRPLPIEVVSGSRLSERYPHFRKQIVEQWGLLNTYFVFPSLGTQDELKITVTLPGDEGRQIPLYVRRIE